MPRRRDVDPTRIAKVLPHVWIYRRDPECVYRCVLAGEEINAWGDPINGRCAGEVMGPDFVTHVRRRLDRMLDEALLTHGIQRERSQYKRVERLAFPIADNDGAPIQIMGASIYRWDRADEAELAASVLI